MKILAITPNLFLDHEKRKLGMEIFYHCSIGLVKCAGTEVDMFLYEKKEVLHANIDGADVSTFTVPGRKWGSLFGEKFDGISMLEYLVPTACRLAFMRRYTKAVLACWKKSGKPVPDLIYAHTWYSAPSASLLAKRLGIPWVLHIYGAQDLRTHAEQNFLKIKFLDRYLAYRQKPDKIIVADDTSFPSWLWKKMGVKPKRVSWQLDPLDLSKYTAGEVDFPLPDKPFEIMTLSRATPIKRIPLAVQAVKLARKEAGLDIRLTVLGKGTEIEKCLKIAQELEGGEWFSAPGFLPKDQIPEKLRNTHLLISPYRTASLSNQVWEAMASGVPTLSVIQGEQQSFIEPYFNALILDEKSNVSLLDTMSKEIISLVNNSNSWKKIRKNALKLISNRFGNLEEQIEKRLEFLKGLVDIQKK